MSRVATIVLAFALGAGCAEAIPPADACVTPAEVTVTLASGALLNPDESGSPLPTEIRVHVLRSTPALEGALFEDAWAPSDALGESIVATQSTTLYPGETTSLVIAASDEGVALAGIAIVRRPAGRAWRVIVPIDDLACGARTTLALRVDEYRIERSPEGG